MVIVKNRCAAAVVAAAAAAAAAAAVVPGTDVRFFLGHEAQSEDGQCRWSGLRSETRT